MTENKEIPELRHNIVEIYTDGACKGNPGVGGWGAWEMSDRQTYIRTRLGRVSLVLLFCTLNYRSLFV